MPINHLHSLFDHWSHLRILDHIFSWGRILFSLRFSLLVVVTIAIRTRRCWDWACAFFLSLDQPVALFSRIRCPLCNRQVQFRNEYLFATFYRCAYLGKPDSLHSCICLARICIACCTDCREQGAWRIILLLLAASRWAVLIANAKTPSASKKWASLNEYHHHRAIVFHLSRLLSQAFPGL